MFLLILKYFGRVELLLRWKADVNTVLENGENALHCAIRSQSVEKVNLILPKVLKQKIGIPCISSYYK